MEAPNGPQPGIIVHGTSGYIAGNSVAPRGALVSEQLLKLPASLVEMEIVGGWCPYTCTELFTSWIRRKNGFPGNPTSSRSTRYTNYIL